MQHGAPVLCADGWRNGPPVISNGSIGKNGIHIGGGGILEERAAAVHADDDHVLVCTLRGRKVNYRLGFLQDADFPALRTGLDAIQGAAAASGQIGLDTERDDISHVPLHLGRRDPIV